MTESQQKVAVTIGVPVARRHIFLCAEQTKPKCCDMERGVAAWEFLKKRLKELGLSEQGGVLRTKANCLASAKAAPSRSVIRRARGTASVIRPRSSGSSRSI
jgi:hypothetical protein